MATNTVSWRDAIKKEARGLNGFDLGEVQDTGTYYVHTQKGLEHKTQYYIPKKLFKSYDGQTLRFDVNDLNAADFVGYKYPADSEYLAKYERAARQDRPAVMSSATASDIVERIPIMAEHLDISKHAHRGEVTITKVPYVETQTRDIGVTHEEVSIEEVKPSANTKVPQWRDDMTEEVIRIPVEHEDIDIRKTPEVQRELVIHKKPVTETRRISEEVRSERYQVSDETNHEQHEHGYNNQAREKRSNE